MGPEAILLSLASTGREGTYRFTCPSCLDAVEKRADRKIVALLVSAGVDVAGPSTSRQAELDDLLGDEEPMPGRDLPNGPPLCYDDLLEFHFLLQDDRYIEDFLAAS
jgi:hypothetical protein